MGKIFEKDCLTGIQFVSYFDTYNEKLRHARILDISYEPAWYRLENYDVQINYIFSQEDNLEDDEATPIHEKDIISNSYDLVIVRTILENKTLDETLQLAFLSSKEDGIVTFNMIDHFQIKDAIKIAERYGYYPCSIINLFSDYNNILTNYEFVGKDESSSNKAIYDLLGFTSLTFTKEKKDVYVCIYDCENIKIPDVVSNEDYYYNAQLYISNKIWCSLSNSEKAIEKDEFGNGGKYIEFYEVDKFIKEIKLSYSGYQKILFSDHFEVDLPRHTSLDELDNSSYYYLSPSILVHRQFDNDLNNLEIIKLSELELRKIIWTQLSEEYILVDKDLNILIEEKQRIYYDEEQEVHSLNKIKLGGKLDLEKTLLYNLIRIKPIGDISLDYLKIYFYTADDTRLQNEITIQEITGRYIINNYEEGKMLKDKSLNKKTLDFLSEKVLHGNYGIETWHIVTSEVLLDSFILVDPIEEQDELVKKYKEQLKQPQLIKAREEVAAWFGKAAVLDKVKELEIKAKEMHHDRVYQSLYGFEKTISAAMRDLQYNLDNNDTEVSIHQFYKAFEIYLRLKIFTNNKFYKEKLMLLLLNRDINSFTLSRLIEIMKDRSYIKYFILVNANSINSRLKLEKILEKILEDRNPDTHTATKYISSDIAYKRAQEVCKTMAELEKVMI